jgi:flagellar hook-basal body complex protein FliE
MTSPIGSPSAQAATAAYRLIDSGSASTGGPTTTTDASSFGSMLERAVNGAVEAGKQADTAASTAIVDGTNLVEVTSAVARAELTLQSAIAIRDRMVQAYQDVMHMAI